MSFQKAVEYMKAAARASYEVKGQKIVQMNYRAIELGGERLVHVKDSQGMAELS